MAGRDEKNSAPVRDYRTKRAVKENIEKYFAHCEQTGEIVGEEGLAYHLHVTVKVLYDWYDGKEHPEYQGLIQRAFAKIDYLNSIDPRFMDKAMASRYIFQKKQPRHGGWQDRQEVKQDVKFELTIKDFDEELAK